MVNKRKCKCGSPDVIYVIQKGRTKRLDFFCSNCLPVEDGGENVEIEKKIGNGNQDLTKETPSNSL